MTEGDLMSSPIWHPDAQAFQQLERRVLRLEGGTVADDDGAPLTVGALQQALADRDERADRHRHELEQLKQRYNDLARYVRGIRGDSEQPASSDRGGSDEAPRRPVAD